MFVYWQLKFADVKSIYETLIRVILFGAVLAGVAQMIYYDTYNITETHLFGENSYTEWMQVTVLFIIILFLIGTGISNSSKRSVTLAMGGFFLMAFIREFDMYLDLIFDGLWQILAYSVLAITVYLLYKRWGDFKNTLSKFFETRSFGLVMAGFLTTFIFSRLYGRSEIWQNLMGNDYIRAVKNISEESVELLGYFLILFGVIEYFLWKRKVKS